MMWRAGWPWTCLFLAVAGVLALVYGLVPAADGIAASPVAAKRSLPATGEDPSPRTSTANATANTSAGGPPSSTGKIGTPSSPTNAEEVRWRQRDVQRWRYADEPQPDLRGEDFRNAQLRFVDLAHADLRGANFEDADLRDADLRGADLRGAVLKRTNLDYSNLGNAVLRGTEMDRVSIFRADLRGADLRGVRFVCRNCRTGPNSLIRPSLAFSHFGGADFQGADLGAIRILDSILDGTDLRGANLADTLWIPKSARGALYNDHTRLPTQVAQGLEPDRLGMVFVQDDDAAP